MSFSTLRVIAKIRHLFRVMLVGGVVLFLMGSCFIGGMNCQYAKSLSGYDREDAVAKYCFDY
jgi:hypothetical protein